MAEARKAEFVMPCKHSAKAEASRTVGM